MQTHTHTHTLQDTVPARANGLGEKNDKEKDKREDCIFWMGDGCREDWRCKYIHNPRMKGLVRKERKRSEKEMWEKRKRYR